VVQYAFSHGKRGRKKGKDKNQGSLPDFSKKKKRGKGGAVFDQKRRGGKWSSWGGGGGKVFLSLCGAHQIGEGGEGKIKGGGDLLLCPFRVEKGKERSLLFGGKRGGPQSPSSRLGGERGKVLYYVWEKGMWPDSKRGGEGRGGGGRKKGIWPKDRKKGKKGRSPRRREKGGSLPAGGERGILVWLFNYSVGGEKKEKKTLARTQERRRGEKNTLASAYMDGGKGEEGGGPYCFSKTRVFYPKEKKNDARPQGRKGWQFSLDIKRERGGRKSLYVSTVARGGGREKRGKGHPA